MTDSHPDKKEIKRLKKEFFSNVGTLEVPWRAKNKSLQDKSHSTDMYLINKVYPTKVYKKGK